MIDAVIDTKTEKHFTLAEPGFNYLSATATHFHPSNGYFQLACRGVFHKPLNEHLERKWYSTDVQIVPIEPYLNMPPETLQLWAQVVVRGELGPDGEFVMWNEETWEQKRQELAAVKPPYEDFPFPGYVATDKLHWLRAEYEAAKDDKEKSVLAKRLLHRSEENGDKNEILRWRTELSKFVSEPASTDSEQKTPSQ